MELDIDDRCSAGVSDTVQIFGALTACQLLRSYIIGSTIHLINVPVRIRNEKECHGFVTEDQHESVQHTDTVNGLNVILRPGHVHQSPHVSLERKTTEERVKSVRLLLGRPENIQQSRESRDEDDKTEETAGKDRDTSDSPKKDLVTSPEPWNFPGSIIIVPDSEEGRGNLERFPLLAHFGLHLDFHIETCPVCVPIDDAFEMWLKIRVSARVRNAKSPVESWESGNSVTGLKSIELTKFITMKTSIYRYIYTPFTPFKNSFIYNKIQLCHTVTSTSICVYYYTLCPMYF